MNAQSKAGADLSGRLDHGVSESSAKHPTLYVLAEVALLVILAALIYGLFKFL